MKIPTPLSEAEAQRAADPTPVAAGQHPAIITEASEGVSERKNETLRLLAVVTDARGNEYRLQDWLSATPRGLLRLRHAAAAVGALDDFEAGHLSAQQFVGREVVVTTEIERKRGYPPRAVIVDYAPPKADRIVNLRGAG
jgi:hypothetical protein